MSKRNGDTAFGDAGVLNAFEKPLYTFTRTRQ
jgi:hypothetical protein